jgi:hypothetical protein
MGAQNKRLFLCSVFIGEQLLAVFAVNEVSLQSAG